MMLAQLLTFVLGVTTSFGQIKVNDVDTRYFVTQFNENQFPMSIDTCNPLSVLGAPYQKAVCLSETILQWTIYQDEACTIEDSVVFTNSTLTQTNSGSYFDFNCDPSYDDAYTAVEFSVGTCNTETKVIMNSALATCVANTELGEREDADKDSLKVYCDSTIAELQYYSSPGSDIGICNDDNIYQVRNATTTCGYMLTTSGTDVYGTILQCSEDPVPTMPDTDDDSASQLSMIVGVFAVIFASLSM